MRRALALLALSGTLLGAPCATAAVTPTTLLAQSSRVPSPPEPTPGPELSPPREASKPVAPRAATPAQVDEDSPGWILPAVIVVAALAVLIALLSLTPLDPARLLRPAGRRFGDAGERASEGLAGLRDRARMGR